MKIKSLIDLGDALPPEAIPRRLETLLQLWREPRSLPPAETGDEFSLSERAAWQHFLVKARPIPPHSCLDGLSTAVVMVDHRAAPAVPHTVQSMVETRLALIMGTRVALKPCPETTALGHHDWSLIQPLKEVPDLPALKSALTRRFLNFTEAGEELRVLQPGGHSRPGDALLLASSSLDCTEGSALFTFWARAQALWCQSEFIALLPPHQRKLLSHFIASLLHKEGENLSSDTDVQLLRFSKGGEVHMPSRWPPAGRFTEHLYAARIAQLLGSNFMETFHTELAVALARAPNRLGGGYDL